MPLNRIQLKRKIPVKTVKIPPVILSEDSGREELLVSQKMTLPGRLA
jgi:hypothetical protein